MNTYVYGARTSTTNAKAAVEMASVVRPEYSMRRRPKVVRRAPSSGEATKTT